MKTMNLFTTICLFILISCNSDDDTGQQAATPSGNNFTVDNTTTYTTDNGYLFLDDGAPFKNSFFLVFADGTFVEDTVNGASASTDTNSAVALFVDIAPGTVATEQDVIINPITYTLVDETTVVTQINSFQNTYTSGGTTYGEPDNEVKFEIGTAGNGTITINAITIDYVARTGTVDCTYSITGEGNEMVSGQFIGSFGIINSF